ncbi:hypothetical protein [Nocardioides cavernaquae]|uniref:Uncharacterized protein n=1 Tax=Nocardioides cavernaquae TaxID=2321396 RepID=A0A3A5HBW9_9ACTN|nr:hypothetical protein [Nocardioides cavernaquae]RJS45540.1 hypothetical protein D4739_04435 [Nocardioides cavernaquae]
MSASPTARPRRHLMDPARPVRLVNDVSLTRVQQWVASVLTVTTVGHLAVGLVVAAFALPAGHTGGRAGLAVIAGAFGMLGVAGALAIHRRPIISPWLLCGFLPGAVGLALVAR